MCVQIEALMVLKSLVNTSIRVSVCAALMDLLGAMAWGVVFGSYVAGLLCYYGYLRHIQNKGQEVSLWTNIENSLQPSALIANE